jgi:hypothetical protein
MKYVRRTNGHASVAPIGACERQCENIDAGAQALRSRGPNGELCGPKTWTWKHEECAENQLVERRTG